MMLDLAEHFHEGPIQMAEIAKRQGVSVKYLEQLIIPLKKAEMIKSIRGPKGGHMLARPPLEITVGEIVRVMENDIFLSPCTENAGLCERSAGCPTRGVWEMAAKAMYAQLDSVTLSEMLR